MNPNQENVLRALTEKYFEGGNAKNDTNEIVLKEKLDALKSFVTENF